MKIQITQGSGLNSGKTGVIVPLSRVPTDHRGIPKIQGHYKPIDPKREIAILLDDGNLTIMFKNRIHRRPK